MFNDCQIKKKITGSYPGLIWWTGSRVDRVSPDQFLSRFLPLLGPVPGQVPGRSARPVRVVKLCNYHQAVLKIIFPLTLHDCGYIPRQMLSIPLAPCTLGDLTISSLEDLEFLCCLLILNRLFTMLPPDLQGHARIWTEPSLSSSELQPLVI